MMREDRRLCVETCEGGALVRIGGRTEMVSGSASDILEAVCRVARQPAPVAWRALGVEP